MRDAPLRVLASGILYRAVLRALPRAPSVADKMRIHQLVEERAWSLTDEQVTLVAGRDVDDGPPEAWSVIVQALVAEALNTPARESRPMEVSGGYKLKPGERAPPFDLPNVDGRRVQLHDFAGSKVLVVAFWCNHCPYVRAYERRFVEWADAMRPRGVGVVAINSNDEVNYPEDSLEHMVERAREQGYNFPYLRDKSQDVATRYGAQCTPHFLVFDKEFHLQYQGRFDDNKDRPDQVKERYLPDVVDALLEGRPAPRDMTWAIGCSIKWG